MKDAILPIIISSIAGLSTILGTIILLIKIPNNKINRFITFCLSFSASIMISISIFDLIPNSFFNILNVYGIYKTIIILIIIIISIYCLIRILSKENKNIDLYKLGIINMLVLILHNIPEGIATFLSSYHDISLGIKLALAILLHNIPEGISIAVPIYYSKRSFKKAFLATLISGISEPIGALVAYIFLKNYINDLLISIILIIVASLMITLSLEKIIPKAQEYKESNILLIGITFGIIIIIINLIIL